MPRFRFTDRDGVEVGSGVGVDGMDVSVGETGVSVGTMGVDVGELQEASSNKKVMKVMKRLMLQIIWANKERRAGILLPSKMETLECEGSME
jgi:hypothetical protein